MLKVVHPCMRAMLDMLVPAFGYTLHLFQNNVVASRNSVFSDFTESTFVGYSYQSPVWSAAFQNGVEDVALADPLTFTAGPGVTGSQTVYGYYVLDSDGDLAWAETFDSGPTTIVADGQQVIIYPQLKMKNYLE